MRLQLLLSLTIFLTSGALAHPLSKRIGLVPIEYRPAGATLPSQSNKGITVAEDDVKAQLLTVKLQKWSYSMAEKLESKVKEYHYDLYEKDKKGPPSITKYRGAKDLKLEFRIPSYWKADWSPTNFEKAVKETFDSFPVNPNPNGDPGPHDGDLPDIEVTPATPPSTRPGSPAQHSGSSAEQPVLNPLVSSTWRGASIFEWTLRLPQSWTDTMIQDYKRRLIMYLRGENIEMAGSPQIPLSGTEQGTRVIKWTTGQLRVTDDVKREVETGNLGRAH